MVRSVLAVLAEEVLALVPQRVHAALHVDVEVTAVGYEQVLFGWRHGSVAVQQPLVCHAHVGQVGEVGLVTEEVVWKERAVDAVSRFDAAGRVLDGVTRRHQDGAVVLAPDLPRRVHVESAFARRQIHLIPAQQDHVLVACGDVEAAPLTVVGREDLAARAAHARLQPVHVDARDLTSPPRTLERHGHFLEDALEGVGDVDARALGAVEGAGEVAALVGDAAAVLGVLLIDAVTRFVGRL